MKFLSKSQSKLNVDQWSKLLTNTKKSKIKSSSNNLILNKNKRYVIWTMNIETKFENWWINIQWNKDTILKMRRHNKSNWENRNRKKELWFEWHEIVDVIVDQSHVLCKDYDFVLIHFSSENIETNIMIRHRSKNVCAVKKNEKIDKQKLLEKSFETICYSWLSKFLLLIILLFLNSIYAW